MSVWPKKLPSARALSGREGDLVSVSINVDARYLESLLEALAQVGFPINPQIYHDAAMVYLYPDDREETQPTTLVEFPAYRGQLDEVQRALTTYGFEPASLHVTGMLDEIQSDSQTEPAPVGAAYVARYRLKHRAAGVQ